MKVIYHNRTELDSGVARGAEYVGFDELLVRSDVLSLNLPLNVCPCGGSCGDELTSEVGSNEKHDFGG